MKNATIYLMTLVFTAMLFMISCKDDEEKKLTTEDLVFSITQTEGYDNEVTLKNETEGTTAFWDYQIGTSTLNEVTVVFPFPGEYTIAFSATTEDGDVLEAEPQTITVSELDSETFSDPAYELLTGGVEGKTWVIDMDGQPNGWYGLEEEGQYHDGVPGGGQDWNWHPEHQSWAYPYQDYGSVTFDVNGAFNMSVHQIDTSGAETDCSGGFELKLDEDGRVDFTCPMLIPTPLYGQTSIDTQNPDESWTKGTPDTTLVMNNMKIFKLVQDTLQVGWVRPEPNEAGGSCYVVIQYISSENK